MDARDVAAMTADALNSMEARLEARIDKIDQGLAEVKHDIELLSVKVDVNQRTTARQMDEGFRQIIHTTARQMDEGFRQIIEHINRR